MLGTVASLLLMTIGWLQLDVVVAERYTIGPNFKGRVKEGPLWREEFAYWGKLHWSDSLADAARISGWPAGHAGEASGIIKWMSLAPFDFRRNLGASRLDAGSPWQSESIIRTTIGVPFAAWSVLRIVDKDFQESRRLELWSDPALWLGAAANIVLFTTAFWIGWASLDLVTDRRRLRRWKDGRCCRCGHMLAFPTFSCQECGALQEPLLEGSRCRC